MRRWTVLLFFAVAHKLLGAGFATLKTAGDARAGGLGMAVTAVADDAIAGIFNPAGLPDVKAEFVLSIYRWISDVQSELVCLGAGDGLNGIGGHVMFTHIGDLEYRDSPSVEPLGTFSAYELILGVSYGRRIGGVRIGTTVKALYEKIDIDDAWGAALDLAFLWPVARGPRFGAAIQNIGGTGRLAREAIDLPLLGRLGISWPFKWNRFSWTPAFDAVLERGESFHAHAGLEFRWQEMLFLRLGYQSGYYDREWGGGLGIRWSRFRLDYAVNPLKSGLGDSHRISIGILL